MTSLLLIAPLIVFALVVVFGFAGCGGEPFTPGGQDGSDGRPDGGGHGGPIFYSEVVDQSGPIAWWTLGDDVGSPVASDKVGAHPGMYVGPVTLGVSPGLDDSNPMGSPATQFDGNGYIEVAPQAGDTTFQTPAFAVELLILPDAMGSSESHPVSNRAPAGGWALFLTPNPNPTPGASGLFSALVWNSSGVISTVSQVYDLAAPEGSGWYVLMQGEQGSLDLRVNGVWAPNLSGPDLYGPNVGADPLQIGWGFQGVLQHVAVYDRMLDPAEIDVHYLASKGPNFSP